VTRSCFRRWYVFLPLLLIVAWHSHSVYRSVKPVYYSNAVIGLAPPSTRYDQAAAPGAPIPRNGLLDIGGAPLVAQMTAMELRQPAVVERVVEAGGTPAYKAKLFPTAPNAPEVPMVFIEVTTSDPQKATKTLELVTAEATVALRNVQQQAQVPDDQMVQAFTVQPPFAPEPGMPSRMRSTMVIFAAGLGLSVVVTVLFDVLLGRLRQRIKVRWHAPRADVPDPDRKPGDVPEDIPETESVAALQESAINAR